MKAKYKKFLIICGKALMLLCLAAFVLVCVFYYASLKDEAQVIRTKAEETKTEVEFPVNYCNTFLFKDRTVSGVTLSVDKNGVLYLSGTPTKGRFVFDCKCPDEYVGIISELLGTSPFFYHSELMGVRFEFCLVIDGVNVYYPRTDMPNSLIPTGNLMSVYMNLVVERAQLEPFNNDAYYVSLYKNANSNFYTPSLLGYYDIAYKDGYEAGKQEGHKEGYEEGYEIGKKDGYEEGFAAGYNDGYGKAVDVLATGLLTKGNSSYINKQLAPSVSGFSCNAYSNYFTYSYAASYSGLLYLNCARSYSNGYKLKIKVESVTVETVFSAMLLDLETSSSAMYEVFRLPVVSSATTYEKVVNLPVSTTRSFKSFVITPASAPSGGTIKGLEIEVVGSEKDYYDNGYDNGYSEGQKFGYDSGYTKGYAMGKSDAMSQMSDSDLPSSVPSFVFSLFDAPVSSFLSAFNLSYDGFDLGSLVAFIFTAIVIVGVIRLVT